MKNREFYKEEILSYIADGDIKFCTSFIQPNILKSLNTNCNDIGCHQCNLFFHIWLEEEYEPPTEPEVDWTKVEVDTPILVSLDGTKWHPRYFAKFENNEVHTWANGSTSWSVDNQTTTSYWKYAKLAEKE